MANTKARGYFRQPGSTSAGHAVTSRNEYDSAIQVAADTVQIGRLLAGHRLVPERCQLIAGGTQALGNVDIYVGDPANVLFNDVTLAAATFGVTNGVNTAVLEAVGVSDEDRDVVMLINSGFATAPAGGLVTLLLCQVPSA